MKNDFKVVFLAKKKTGKIDKIDRDRVEDRVLIKQLASEKELCFGADIEAGTSPVMIAQAFGSIENEAALDFSLVNCSKTGIAVKAKTKKVSAFKENAEPKVTAGTEKAT